MCGGLYASRFIAARFIHVCQLIIESYLSGFSSDEKTFDMHENWDE